MAKCFGSINAASGTVNQAIRVSSLVKEYNVMRHLLRVWLVALNLGMLIAGMLIAGSSGAQPAPVLDIAQMAPEDGQLRRVYGASGEGRFGVPVAGGHDVDGDGFVDYAVAYMRASPGGQFSAGEVDLIFGDGTTGGTVDTALDDPRVLRFFGTQVQETAGSEIWMDDVTGDGLGDLLISRQNHTPDSDRLGAGALTVVVGGPGLRIAAASLQAIDLTAPSVSIPLTTLVGAHELDRFGIWARTGDVTGDGVADIVVGADQEDSGGESNRGAAYVIRGGPHLAAGGVIDLLDPAVTTIAEHIAKITPPAGSGGYHFGATCQIADLDGNGRSEVLVAATINRAGATLQAAGAPPGSAEASGGAPDGTLYIAWDDNFPAEAWPAGFNFDISASPGARTIINGEIRSVSFGEEILGGADFDADGLADLFIGDLVADGTVEQNRPASGFGHVFFDAGQLAGLEFDLETPPPGLSITRILGPEGGAIAADTAAQGDFDGDGFSDLAFTSPHANPQGRINAGAVHVLFGRPDGWPARIDLAAGSFPAPSEIRIAEIQGARGLNGSDLGDTLGYSAAAGDIDDDGLSDLIVNEMVGNGVDPGAIDVGNLLILSGKALREDSCDTSATELCLLGDRFRVEATWRDFAGETGSGQGSELTDETGTFWFFDPANVELVVKVLDGCATPLDSFWVFAGGLTDVEVELTVTDTVTGQSKIYSNALGSGFEPIRDTAAFATCPASGGGEDVVVQVAGRAGRELETAGSCVADDTTLCLSNGRFAVEALWQTSAAESGSGQAVPLTGDTGYFWFFSAANVEVVIKVLNACDLPPFNTFWVFAAGLTDVEVTLRVTDTVSSQVREYFNPLGAPFQPIRQTDAFDTCP